MKNACVVGYGAIGPIHCEGISKTENVKLYAICDIIKERADNGAQQYGAKVYYDFDEMLKDENIDSVHICTPHYLHYEMVVKSLNAGKKVITEKPVTIKKEDFENLRDKDVCVMFQNRTNECIARLKEIAEKKSDLICARGILTWKRTAEYYAADEWRGTLLYEGGGVLINQAIHMLDMMTYLCGDVKTVQAKMSNRAIPEIEVEDTMDALFEFEDGKKGVFYATNAFGVDSPFFVELIYPDGIYRYMDGKLYYNNEVICEDIVEAPGKIYWGGGHRKVIDAFYNGGKYTKLKDCENTMKTMFAMYESANNNGINVKV